MARPSVAVALGGGGARGLAHIVLLEVLDEMGIRPVAIAGCSMGAIVGAPYAAGMPGRDIRHHALRVLRNRRLVLGRMLEARVGRFTELFTQGIVNPVLIDGETLLPMFWPATVPARFEDLSIPLAVTATDFNARAEVVIRSGPLLNAVAASMALPGLVKPVIRDNRVLVDGGVVNPLPYDLLLGGADVVLACDVSQGRVDDTGAVPKPFAAMLGATQIMQTTSTARMLRWQPPDLLVRPAVEGFRLLDFFYAARILQAADGMRDAVKRDLEGLLAGTGSAQAAPNGSAVVG